MGWGVVMAGRPSKYPNLMRIEFKDSTQPANLAVKMSHMDDAAKQALRLHYKSLYHAGVVAMGPKVPKWHGDLKASFWIGRRATASYVDKNGNGFGIGSRLAYAPWMDSPRRWFKVGVLRSTIPNWPRTASLRAWVIEKVKPKESKVNAVTYLIGRKIALFGYRHGGTGKGRLPAHNFIKAGELAIVAAQQRESPRMLKKVLSGIGQ